MAKHFLPAKANEGGIGLPSRNWNRIYCQSVNFTDGTSLTGRSFTTALDEFYALSIGQGAAEPFPPYGDERTYTLTGWSTTTPWYKVKWMWECVLDDGPFTAGDRICNDHKWTEWNMYHVGFGFYKKGVNTWDKFTVSLSSTSGFPAGREFSMPYVDSGNNFQIHEQTKIRDRWRLDFYIFGVTP